MRVKGLMKEDAKDRTKRRAMSWGAKGNFYNSRKNSLKTSVVVVVQPTKPSITPRVNLMKSYAV